MAQNDTDMNIIPWTPTPTLLSPEWLTRLEEVVSKTKGPGNYIAGMHYDSQGTVRLLREWGLPWMVVVAGAFLFHEEKELRSIAIEDREQFLSHIQQARRYIDCIEDDDLSTLLSSPYDDLGARLIAVATYYVALQGLAQRKNKRSFSQHELSRIEAIGTTLIHITKQVNLWLFKRNVEDLILQLRAPLQYKSIKEEHQKILQQDEEKLRDFCRVASAFCHRLTQIPVSITYEICGVEGFSRRRQLKQTTTTSQEALLTGFDLVIFDVIVPTLKDCYEIFGALNHLGYQDQFTEQLAHPKLNGSSHLSCNLALSISPYLHELQWISQDKYTCQIQIATHAMNAVTRYGCLYPTCYQLYTEVPLEANESFSLEKLWTSQEGNIYTSIIESFKRKQGQGDAAAPITVYDKKLRPFSFPKGATVLDFAYAYDENLTGYVYGFINDREVPLYRKLNAGDIIDIKISNALQTHEYWVERKYATTSRALNAIQKQRFHEHKGYLLLRQKLEYYRYKLTEGELAQELYDFVRNHHLGTVNAYLKQFNEGADLRYTPDWAAEQIMQQIRERNEQVIAAKPKWVVRLDAQFAETPIYYLPKSFCNVCQPTYPRDDKIVGYASQREKVLVIHSAHCPRLMDKHHKQRAPLYSLTWHLLPTFRVGFAATAHDRRGFILDVSKLLRHHQCSLVSIYAEAVHKDAQLRFVIETYDTGEVLDLLQKMRKVENIIDIDIDPLKTAPHVYEKLQHLRAQPLPEKIETEYTLEEAQLIPASRRPMLRNPFNISRPPGEKMFFGRTPEIKKLQRELCADERGKAIFLYGPRRSGKSSLCNHFLEHYVYSPYWYVYHSLQGATGQDETTILMQIAEEVSWIFQERFHQRSPSWQDFLIDDPQVRLKRVLQKCLATVPGARLVLVLDEFGGAIEAYQKKFLDGRFFTYWRNLMSDIPQLSLIFVLPTIPHSFLTSGQLAGAFSFMEAYSMEFLDEESARQLLVNPLQEENIVIRPGTIKRILDLTGCNPYYLTLVGAQIVSQLNLDPHKCLLNNEDLDSVVERLIKGNTKQNFYFYHDELHAEEIPIVKAIVDITQQSGQPAASLKKIAVRLQKPIEALRPHLKRLQEGLILREQEAQWTSSQPYYAFTIELVRLWMTQNKDFFLPTENMEG